MRREKNIIVIAGQLRSQHSVYGFSFRSLLHELQRGQHLEIERLRLNYLSQAQQTNSAKKIKKPSTARMRKAKAM